MSPKRSLRLITTGLLLGGAVLTRTVSGYIDPGTGSYVLQITIAFLIGLAFSIKVFWRRIAAFFRKIVSGKKGDGADAS
jgi:hypothetical protein